MIKFLARAGLAALCAAALAACSPTESRTARLQQSPQWHKDHFENPQPLWVDTRSAYTRMIFGRATPLSAPEGPLPGVDAATASAALAAPPPSGLRVTWFGHSSALIEIDGVRVLTDPLWSERASPVSWFGPKRWQRPSLELAALPPLDAVLISHDHYDHLDRGSILALASGTAAFVVPLGIGLQLSEWGIPPDRIIELDWWQSATIKGVEVTATPARHRSGIVPWRANETLWAGYAVAGKNHRAWYSGDTGYHDGLTEIGTRLGPFNVTLIEAGQYDARWPDAHLGPEQAVAAHRLVRGRVMIPVHWGALKLSENVWTEPVERVLTAAAKCDGTKVLTPRLGESIEPTKDPATPKWWPTIPGRSALEAPIVATQNGDPSRRVAVNLCPTEAAT